MIAKRSVTLPLALALAAAPALAGVDPHSFSRPDQVAVTHIELDLTVDFELQRLAGSAVLSLDRRQPDATELVLDTRDLEIDLVRLDDSGDAVAYELGEPVPGFGRSLTIPLAAGTRKVRIDYRTRPEAAAIQWLEPSQTAGGQRPFLFTQSQAILARTWVPCQDSPGVRFTYAATVRVPADLTAVMSAAGNPHERSASGFYRFRMEQPIPSYLLALAVGDLEFRPLGARSGVYAEPSVAAAAASELVDTEAMISAAEGLYGPYRWERYDLLILPPSFPFGGMENPRLTFATPTILAGDRSLVALVAHELAHSWSGNLVTNATWDDFWLNEGFTSYFENRIMEAVYGADYADMLASLSRQELDEFLAHLGSGHRDSWLHGDFAGRDPDDGVGPIAYDKGALFLRTLEEAAGREAFDAFLRRYFDTHAFQSMTTARFVEILRQGLYAQQPQLAARVPIEAWVYGPDIPEGAATVSPAAFSRVDHELERWTSGTPAAELATEGWVTLQWLHLLGRLPSGLEVARLAELDDAFDFSASGNAEIFAAWAVAAIPAGYQPVLPQVEQFLKRVGRRKFLTPIYRALLTTPEGTERARAIYAKARPGYHTVARQTMDALLGWESDAATATH